MFTQCSKCETVFRLSADALRAAGGQVRCGRCGEVFNALSRLAEDSNGFVKGESSLDLETRADEILESAQPAQAGEAIDQIDLPAGVEGAQLQFIDPVDDELTDENSLEFTLPPGELDRIFVETRSIPLQQLGSDDTHTERSERSERSEADAPVLPALIAPVIVDPTLVSPAPVDPMPATPPAPHPEDAALLTRIPRYDYADLPEINESQRRLPMAVWLIAAVVLGFLLVIQIVHANHEWLATHAPKLLTGYATTPSADLESYQLRQWGVTGDPAAKGTLRVRASIMNTAAQLQRYPLLRVSLLNRFGSRVGAREFEPSEYLGKATARMLAPGERADATLDILDPGKDAEGFEIDVCIRGADKAVVCAGDAASQTQ